MRTTAIVIIAGTMGLMGFTSKNEPKSILLGASSTSITAADACDRTQLNKAITHYRQAYRTARKQMRTTGPVPRVWYRNCVTLQRRAIEWRDRATEARWLANAWTHWHYSWAAWLPDKWQRIGACETGYGQRPGNWQHRSSGYQGAFGFANRSWATFRHQASLDSGPYPTEAYQATPRQQYEVALAIHRRYGLSGWGCRNA